MAASASKGSARLWWSGPSPIADRSRGADLHIHTTHSDGALTPAGVVRAAHQRGLAALAITDHDTMSGSRAGRVEARRLGIELIPALELSAEDEEGPLHLLGYFVDDRNESLQAALEDLDVRRRERAEAIVHRLQAQGFVIDLRRLQGIAPRGTLGRGQIADWLVGTGQLPDRRAAFDGVLSDAGLADLPAPRVPSDRALRLIQEAGGVASWAHPPASATLERLARLIARGLEAIEVAGPSIPGPRRRRLRSWADEHDLVPTAGSDFHRPGPTGQWIGRITADPTDLERLRARVRAVDQTNEPDGSEANHASEADDHPSAISPRALTSG